MEDALGQHDLQEVAGGGLSMASFAAS